MEIKQIARTFYQIVDAIGSGEANASALKEIMADSFVAHLPSGGGDLGREGFGAVVDAYRTGFPGATHTIEDIVADADRIAVRITWRGTHTGVFQGAPATNNSVEMSEMGILRVKQGKVVEFWPLFDSMTLMSKVGLAKQ